MTVRFHSDNLGTETGFLAKWEEINVDGNKIHLALAIFLNPTTYHMVKQISLQNVEFKGQKQNVESQTQISTFPPNHHV